MKRNSIKISKVKTSPPDFRNLILKFNQNIKNIEVLLKNNQNYSSEMVESLENEEYQQFRKMNLTYASYMEEIVKNIFNNTMKQISVLCTSILNSQVQNNYEDREYSQYYTKLISIESEFQKSVEEILCTPAPNCLVNPYLCLMKEEIDSAISKKMFPLSLKGNSQRNFTDYCNYYLTLLLNKKIIIFDKNIIGKKWHEIVFSFLHMIESSKKSFIIPQNNEFINLIFSIIDFLSIPFGEKETVKNNFSQFAFATNNKKIRIVQFNDSINSFAEIIRGIDNEIQNFIAFCLFISLSNCYDFKGLRCSLYPSLNQKITRKIIFKLGTNYKQISNIFNYCNLSLFENELGMFLKERKDILKPLNAFFLNESLALFYDKRSVIFDGLEELKKVHCKMNLNELISYNKIKLAPLMQTKNKNITANSPILKIDSILNFQKEFQFCRISENCSSRNLVICVSGFLSENSNDKELWKKIIEFFPFSQICSIKYPSSSLNDLLSRCLTDISLSPQNDILGYIINLLSPENKNSNPISQEYELALKNAKNTGKLLAISIAIGLPFTFESITLVGFSLGSQVITTCIKYLYLLNIFNRIQDVIIIGGSTSLKSKVEKYLNYFEVVNGKVFNCYSKNDKILKLVKKFYQVDPIGLHKLQFKEKNEESNDNILKKGKFVRNSKFSYNHLEYRENLETVIQQIYGNYFKNANL